MRIVCLNNCVQYLIWTYKDASGHLYLASSEKLDRLGFRFSCPTKRAILNDYMNQFNGDLSCIKCLEKVQIFVLKRVATYMISHIIEQLHD